MAYGTQVNINGNDMVSMVDPVLFLDNIISASGSRTYTVPTGYTLQYFCGVNGLNKLPSVSINGNTVTWSGGSTVSFIYIFLGR